MGPSVIWVRRKRRATLSRRGTTQIFHGRIHRYEQPDCCPASKWRCTASGPATSLAVHRATAEAVRSCNGSSDSESGRMSRSQGSCNSDRASCQNHNFEGANECEFNLFERLLVVEEQIALRRGRAMHEEMGITQIRIIGRSSSAEQPGACKDDGAQGRQTCPGSPRAAEKIPQNSVEEILNNAASRVRLKMDSRTVGSCC